MIFTIILCLLGGFCLVGFVGLWIESRQPLVSVDPVVSVLLLVGAILAFGFASL